MPSTHPILLLLFIALLLNACATKTELMEIQQPPLVSLVSPAHSTNFSAAAIEADLTPPPGMSLGGYSIMSKVGQGFRTRIKARVIYLNADDQHALALVQTDLASGSLLLHHQVAAMVAEQTGLQPANIVITATHSHSSVANHFNNDFYNKHFSSQKGLAKDYFEFISAQISQAIIQAHQQQKPAKIATGRKNIYGYNRNRSLASYRLNPGHEDIDLDDPQAKFKAVNPALQMIRIDAQDADGHYKPLAAFSSFAVHATSFSAAIDIYNADLFAYAQKELEWFIADKYQPSWQALHALTTSTQGDMAPAIPEYDSRLHYAPLKWLVTRDLGQRLGQEAIALFESLAPDLSKELTLQSSAREININEENKIDDIELCQTPYVGNAVSGGAYEHRTPWLTLIPFFNGGSGWTKAWLKSGCQGNKRILGTSLLQPLLEPSSSFPKTVMFQIIRINDTLILPLPFEITTEAGHRITKAVKEVFNTHAINIKHCWITSVSNGYFGYSTSEQEYSQQEYEGGHTLYGRYSSPYLRAQLKRLARNMQQGFIQELHAQWRYPLKSKTFFSSEFLSIKASTDTDSKRTLLQEPDFQLATSQNEESFWQMQWLDVKPEAMRFHQPLLEIQSRNNSNSPWQTLKIGRQLINDNGYDLEVRHLGAKRNEQHKYQARWYLNSESIAALDFKNKQYRFVIAARPGRAALYQVLKPEAFTSKRANNKTD